MDSWGRICFLARGDGTVIDDLKRCHEHMLRNWPPQVDARPLPIQTLDTHSILVALEEIEESE